jgi:hypothetical protein
MPAISKEDSFNQLTIAELEKVLLNNFNLKIINYLCGGFFLVPDN